MARLDQETLWRLVGFKNSAIARQFPLRAEPVELYNSKLQTASP
ncbi:MAG: hypothetical protein QGG67_06615 [Gammaproteobacteria bacterium]|nr:hypothetical protein [Gammaproteobacteria bacterium]MDP7455702.1 hypothetical protein [Gammaproteobacteria bacterium]